jgi:hypothetical protein
VERRKRKNSVVVASLRERENENRKNSLSWSQVLLYRNYKAMRGVGVRGRFGEKGKVSGGIGLISLKS